MTVADKWRVALKETGYDHSVSSARACRKLGHWPRAWRRIFQYVHPSKAGELSAFEFGCGGGKHLVTLGLNGWRCVGLDCSEEVLARAKAFIQGVSQRANRPLEIELTCRDFLEYELDGETAGRYDLVFQFGAMEHFLEDTERRLACGKMFGLAKPGGYVVSAVPNGAHPMRQKMRALGLGGYLIPEIDYTCESLKAELLESGGREAVVLPHNLFGYITIDHHGVVMRSLRKFLYYLWQLVPIAWLPHRFSCQHAYWLIGIARKP